MASPLPQSNAGPRQALQSELARRITQLRLKRDLSQARLAREAGISTATVKRLESGQSVQLSHWLGVLQALGLQESVLLAIPDPELSPMTNWRRKKGQSRLRASKGQGQEQDQSKRASASKNPNWKWGQSQPTARPPEEPGPRPANNKDQP